MPSVTKGIKIHISSSLQGNTCTLNFANAYETIEETNQYDTITTNNEAKPNTSHDYKGKNYEQNYSKLDFVQ